MTNIKPRYSVVVPVYESSQSVRKLVERLHTVFKEQVKKKFEIILVDDGSKNVETWETLESLSCSFGQVVAVKLMRNYGKAGAVLCGLSMARGDWIITIDDDLQQLPEDIPKLIEFEDHDVVVANFKDRKHGRFTVFTSWIKSHFDQAILKLPCKMSPLKLFKSEVARGMLSIHTARPFIPALMAYVTNDFISVSLEHDVSHHGKSRYSFKRRIKQFSNLLIGNSNLTLRAIGMLGMFAAISGFLYAFYIIIRRIFGTVNEPGWTTLVSINLLFGGLILVVLGIIGEYLIRILEGNSSMPAYIVREISGNTSDMMRLKDSEETCFIDDTNSDGI